MMGTVALAFDEAQFQPDPLTTLSEGLGGHFLGHRRRYERAASPISAAPKDVIMVNWHRPHACSWPPDNCSARPTGGGVHGCQRQPLTSVRRCSSGAVADPQHIRIP